MEIPAKFPPGCYFVASFSGEEYVRFPDGAVYRLTDAGDELLPVGDLPRRGASISESVFLNCAKTSRAFSRGSTRLS
jgi:hypothetical protein